MSDEQPVIKVRLTRPGIRSVPWHLFLAVLSGLMLTLAFPEPGWSVLAHVALVPMVMLALRSDRPRTLAWTTYVIGIIWWMVLLRWMIPVTLIGYILLSFFLGVYWPWALLWVRYLVRRYKLPAIVALPMVWVSLEWVRGYFPSDGFGWFILGHSQAPYLPEHGVSRLIQSADLFGVWTVSLIVAMTNGLIVDQLTQPWYEAHKDTKRLNRKVVGCGAAWLAVVVAAMGYGNWRIEQTKALSIPGPRVAIIQTNVPQDNKENPTFATEKQAWATLRDLSRQAAKGPNPPDLIVWPETMVPGPIDREGSGYWADMSIWRRTKAFDPTNPDHQKLADQMGVELEKLPDHLADWFQWWSETRDRCLKLSQELNAPIAVGAATNKPDNSPGYNSVYLVHPDGTASPKVYHKINLVPFGESVPWVEHWPWLKKQFVTYLTPYDQDYSLSRGDSLTVFESFYTDGNGQKREFRFATPICFEDTVARLCRPMVYDRGNKRCDALVNLTNDGWFAHSDEGAQHLQIAVFRCIENRVPMVRSVNTGVSGFIDSPGRVGPLVRESGFVRDVEGVAVHTLRLDSRTSVFALVGQGPIIVLVMVTFAMVGIPWGTQRGQHWLKRRKLSALN